MPTWSQVTQPYGEYVSESFDITNTLDRYVIEIDIQDLNIHHQTMEFYFSVSHDNINWTVWERFYEQSTDFLNNFTLNPLYFRYRVIFMSETLDVRPYLQSISLTLTPYTLFENFSDLPTKPKLWITKVNGAGDIKLLNHMTGQEMIFTDLMNNEEVYVDCENEELISSFQNTGIYRYDHHNDEWLEMNVGESYLKGFGDFNLNIRHQGRLLQD